MKQLFDLAYRWYEPTLLLQKKDETAIGLFNTIRCLMNNVAMAVLSLSTSTLSVPNDKSDTRSRKKAEEKHKCDEAQSSGPSLPVIFLRKTGVAPWSSCMVCHARKRGTRAAYCRLR